MGGSERRKTRRGTLPHIVTIYEVTVVPLALALQLFWTGLTYILSAVGSRPLPDMRPSLGQAVALLFACKYLLTRAKHPLLSHGWCSCWVLWVVSEAHNTLIFFWLYGSTYVHAHSYYKSLHLLAWLKPNCIITGLQRIKPFTQNDKALTSHFKARSSLDRTLPT